MHNFRWACGSPIPYTQGNTAYSGVRRGHFRGELESVLIYQKWKLLSHFRWEVAQIQAQILCCTAGSESRDQVHMLPRRLLYDVGLPYQPLWASQTRTILPASATSGSEWRLRGINSCERSL